MARIPYLSREDMSKEDRKSLESYQNSDVDMTPHVIDPSAEYLAFREEKSSNLYGLLAYNPEILGAFREYASALRSGCGLDERVRELVILVAARELEAKYVWNHHVRIAFEFDITGEEVTAVAQRRYDTFDESEAAFLQYVRAYASRTVDDETLATAIDAFDNRAVVGASMIVSSYVGLDYFQKAFDIDIGEPFVGWELENIDAIDHVKVP